MVETPKVKIQANNFNVFFGKNQVVKSLNMEVYSNEILGIIGPANSGKTTFLKTLNRLNDLDDDFRMEGSILLDGRDINSQFDVIDLRKKVSIIFAMPLPLPISIFDNVAYGPKMHGIKKGLDEIVERSLKAAYIWEEVKDRLHESALNLSGGQQQRLCIARSLAIEPEVVLFDEPCSGLDPISTAKVEEAMMELKKKYTIILVTNNVKQAARVSDRVAFFLMGELIELDSTEKMFTNPSNKKTIDYISGRFG
ncbi:MAG: phosphate ABC transporter ATP-binding protein [Elusimicrobia bacterium RIFOXYB2_FULL_48_7]|nr:MAG: phosphate ABC transporter ATP-binding protein [Elusimicrobia bacterium RIFOXYB2_FULL_48_7]